VLVCEREIASRFRRTLPAELSERVIAETDVNLVGEEPAVIADALEPLIHSSWLARTTALVDAACERSRAGGAAALGARETAGALAEGRVEHLILDPQHDFSDAEAPHAATREPPDMIGERSVEAAVATGARVTSLSGDDAPALRDAGGIVALLRY
jgi:stalled ribosome rescue protein Dom34